MKQYKITKRKQDEIHITASGLSEQEKLILKIAVRGMERKKEAMKRVRSFYTT